MSAVDLLMRLGACREAIDWAEARVGLTDLEIWQACDDPHWLEWLLVRCGEIDRDRLRKALRPVWAARREAIWQAQKAYNDAVCMMNGYDAEYSEEIDRQYIDARIRADHCAASMIRHTVAMPTRPQIVAALERPEDPDCKIPF